ncbi:MAG: fucose isomerase [Lachnospiraceae bacterium]|nr:fucose isomerase [Lachnospiraceae bacterium]
MLKGIPKLISPELLKILCEMGHGNEIAIVDANYPAEDMGARVIRYPGIGVCELLTEVLKLFPLDHIVDTPAYVLGLEKKDIEAGMKTPPIWAEMQNIINANNDRDIEIGVCSRQEFYERSRKAYAIIQTGEEALYADLLLVKGVIK